MKKIIFALVVVLLLAGLSLSCSPAPAEVIEINAVGMLPIDHAVMAYVPTIIDKYNQVGEGKVVWKYLGGGDVIPSFDQFHAVASGVADASFTVTAYYPGEIPAAYSTGLSRITPWEERETGFVDLMDELHREQNTVYLGRWHKTGFYFWLTEPANSIADLKGRKIRSGGAMTPAWTELLGGTPVSMPPPDVYTALQQGVVEGVTWPALGICDLGWCEVITAVLDYEALPTSNASLIVNLDTWNRIPKRMQDKLIDATAEWEHEMVAHYDKLIAEHRQIAKDAGVQFIKLSPAEGTRVLEAAYEATWAKQKEMVSPELYEKLKRLTGN